MKAVRYDTFEGPIRLVDVPDLTPSSDGVVVKVGASGLCRSDWHGWMGHDADVKVPHVPGHEFAGTVLADQSEPPVPMSQVIARELEIMGSHGLQAREYAGMLDLITTGQLRPDKLLGRTITVSQVGPELARMGSFPGVGVTVAVLD